MRFNIKPALYLVTDRTWLRGRSLSDAVELAVKGGVNVVQLRDKGRERAEIVKTALELKEILKPYGVPLIINDDPIAAKLSSADGVHLGASDGGVASAREYLGGGFIIGGSARDTERARLLEREGADYLGVGAVFGTSTKSDAKTIDVDILRAVAASVSIPAVAIGGVNEDNISRLKGSGVAGAAVVSAILAKDDIYRAALQLKSALVEILNL